MTGRARPSANIGALESHFVAELERLSRLPVSEMGVCGIAVSGGPDSMALLGLAQAAMGEKAAPALQIKAATIDHQLRAQSKDEAAMVAGVCAQMAIDHTVLTPKAPISGNIQSAARTVRYALLQQWAADHGIDWILTAHHGDDQLETIIMRLNRGSGVAGMSGIRARNFASDRAGHTDILRPLLPLTKAQLLGYVKQRGIPFVTDPSNSNADFDRVAIRQKLADCDWLDPLAANRSADALDQANLALVWAADHMAKTHLHLGAGSAQITPADMPKDILIRLVFLALQHVQPDRQPRGSALERVTEALIAGQTTTQGDVICAKQGARWSFSPAPPRAKR